MPFVFEETDVDNLVKLMRTVNFKLLLDLNLQLRHGTQWDPTNTANLLGYVNRMKYHDVFNFELGNGKIFLYRDNMLITSTFINLKL